MSGKATRVAASAGACTAQAQSRAIRLYVPQALAMIATREVSKAVKDRCNNLEEIIHSSVHTTSKL